jgi:flagellar protein FliO/FliZ
MAQRLEAALRRPAGGDNVAPPVQPESPPARPSRSEAPFPAPQKTSFENLEDEMASLLGRPKNSS